MKQKRPVPQRTVATGQLWQMTDSHLEITLVGKTLVHYKHFKQGAKRTSISLLDEAALEEFLRRNKAVLILGVAANRPADSRSSAAA